MEKKLAEKKQQERLAKTGKWGETKPVETKMYGVVLSTMPIEGKGPGNGYGTRQATSLARRPPTTTPPPPRTGPPASARPFPSSSTAQSGLKRTFKSAKANDPAAFTSYKDKKHIFAVQLGPPKQERALQETGQEPGTSSSRLRTWRPASPKGGPSPRCMRAGKTGRRVPGSRRPKPVVYASEEPPGATRGGKNDLLDFNSLLKELKDKAYESKGQSWDPERYPKLNAFLIQRAAG